MTIENTKPEMTESAYRAMLDRRDCPPTIVSWGKSATVLAYQSLASALDHARRGTDYMHDEARAAWEMYHKAHEGKGARERRWHGGVWSFTDWERVSKAPPAALVANVDACLAALDAVPLPMREAPRRRNMRHLDEGDTLDAVRMVEDCNLDRAWSERRRSTVARPSLRIVLNGGINCNLDERSLAWRGAAALAIARRAEDCGADVEIIVAINWTRCATDTMRDIVASWCVKERGAYADRDTLTAYCCHFASFRWFAWCLMAQNMPGHRVCGAWGRMERVAGCVDHLKPDVIVDYGVTSRDTAIALMRQAMEIIEAQRGAD